MSEQISLKSLLREEGHSKEFDEGRFLEAWKDIVRQLKFAKTSESDAHEAALRAVENEFSVTNLQFRDLHGSEGEFSALGTPGIGVRMPWSVHNAERPLSDYIEGASYAINPFPFAARPYTSNVDLAAIVSDWTAVRVDMIAAWDKLIEDNPLLAQMIAPILEEVADARGSGSKRS